MKAIRPIVLDEIPQEILTYLGGIEGITFPRQGQTSDVGIIQSKEGIAVLKRTRGKQFCEWLRKEIEVLNGLTTTDLPIPKVYTVKDEGEEVWALFELLEGVTLRSYFATETEIEKKHAVIYQFGQTLARIHDTPCPPSLQKGNWLDHMLQQAAYNLANYQVDGTKQQLDYLVANKPKEIRQTLIHGDFTIDNLLVKDGVISGLIDWSGGAFGDPRYDAALAIRPKPSIFESENEIVIFFEGYGKKIIDNEEYRYFKEGLYEFF